MSGDRPLDVSPKAMPKAEIRTEEQATAFVEELTLEMIRWRNECNVKIPGNPNVQAQRQRKALWTFLTKQGQVVGAIKAFKLAGLISDKCFMALHQKALNSLIPSVMGTIK